MTKARIYYGVNDDDHTKIIYATVTGQMADGTLVYTEIEQTDKCAIVTENGEPKLILDNQYIRFLRRGMQTFKRL